MRSSLFWSVPQRWLVVTDVSRKVIGPSSGVKRSKKNVSSEKNDSSRTDQLLKMGADGLSQNVGNYQSTLRNIPEEQLSRLYRRGSPKSCRKMVRRMATVTIFGTKRFGCNRVWCSDTEPVEWHFEGRNTSYNKQWIMVSCNAYLCQII
jgi:hypothetical protein